VSRAVLLSCLSALLAACSSSRPAGDAPEKPEVVMYGVKLRSYEGSTLTHTGRAERATYRRASGALVAERATVRFMGSTHGNGLQGDLTVSAPLMEGQLGSRRLEASGGVEVRTADGVVANAPRATYDAAVQSVQGSEGVRLEGQGYSLQADTFSLALSEQSFTFEGSVQTVLGAARD